MPFSTALMAPHNTVETHTTAGSVAAKAILNLMLALTISPATAMASHNTAGSVAAKVMDAVQPFHLLEILIAGRLLVGSSSLSGSQPLLATSGLQAGCWLVAGSCRRQRFPSVLADVSIFQLDVLDQKRLAIRGGTSRWGSHALFLLANIHPSLHPCCDARCGTPQADFCELWVWCSSLSHSPTPHTKNQRRHIPASAR
jgi:hypothetical protein